MIVLIIIYRVDSKTLDLFIGTGLDQSCTERFGLSFWTGLPVSVHGSVPGRRSQPLVSGWTGPDFAMSSSLCSNQQNLTNPFCRPRLEQSSSKCGFGFQITKVDIKRELCALSWHWVLCILNNGCGLWSIFCAENKSGPDSWVKRLGATSSHYVDVKCKGKSSKKLYKINEEIENKQILK